MAFTSEVSELSTLPPFSEASEASISFSVRGARGRRKKKSLLNATHRLTDADRPYMRAIAKRARLKIECKLSYPPMRLRQHTGQHQRVMRTIEGI